ncbi:hypothetical protein ANN_09997 [Periplaneta americana]|uniref:Uncharacterized protein n=1 Tax=Periplaneta americana TaxID=6978 RepID=A0ABQ8TN59_PERAM|nr:hypothetical protein ANN_09997 [Periplaneta americana]
MGINALGVAVCAAVLCVCWGQTALEEPKQNLDEGRKQLQQVYVPSTSVLEPQAQADVSQDLPTQGKDDMQTQEHFYWGYRPYYRPRSWGWGRGWGWNGYSGYGDYYGYGRRYPYYYYWG